MCAFTGRQNNLLIVVAPLNTFMCIWRYIRPLMNMIIVRAALTDAADILHLQKLAYRSEAEVYRDFTIPPLTQTVAQLEAEFTDHLFLIATADRQIVGSVRALSERDTCRIGRLIVHPDRQNRGIGTRLIHEVEQLFNAAKRYELFTGDRSEGNIRLYRRLGDQIYRREPVTDKLTLVFMEKFKCVVTSPPHDKDL